MSQRLTPVWTRRGPDERTPALDAISMYGRAAAYEWRSNVIEFPAKMVADVRFDCSADRAADIHPLQLDPPIRQTEDNRLAAAQDYLVADSNRYS